MIQEAREADIPIMTYCVGTTGKVVPALLIDEASVASQMGVDMAKQWMSLYPDKPVQTRLCQLDQHLLLLRQQNRSVPHGR